MCRKAYEFLARRAQTNWPHNPHMNAAQVQSEESSEGRTWNVGQHLLYQKNDIQGFSFKSHNIKAQGLRA